MKLEIHPVCRDANARIHIITTLGHKWVTAVVIDYPMRLVQLPVDDHGLTPLFDANAGVVYSTKKAVKAFKQLAKSHGITDGAKEALNDLE